MKSHQGEQCTASLLADDLLLKDRGHERFEDGARPWDADTRIPARQVGDRRMAAERRRFLVQTKERGYTVENALRTRTPGFGQQLAPEMLQGDCGRAVGCPRRSPHPSRGKTDGSVAGAATKGRKRSAQVEGAVDGDGSIRHCNDPDTCEPVRRIPANP
jgi:hypothetical protein